MIELIPASVRYGAGESLKGRWHIRAKDVSGRANIEMGG